MILGWSSLGSVDAQLGAISAIASAQESLDPTRIVIASESRSVVVSAEDRTIAIPVESRSIVIEDDDP